MAENLKERVTNEDISLNLAILDQEEARKYVHKIGSQRMAEYIKSQLSKKKLPNYVPCSDGGPCTA